MLTINDTNTAYGAGASGRDPGSGEEDEDKGPCDRKCMAERGQEDAEEIIEEEKEKNELEGLREVTAESGRLLVAAPGFFTGKYSTSFDNCQKQFETYQEKAIEKYSESPKLGGFEVSMELGEKVAHSVFNGFATNLAESIFEMTCGSDISLIPYMEIIMKPIQLTTFPIVVWLYETATKLGKLLFMIAIVFYGILYSLGRVRTTLAGFVLTACGTYVGMNLGLYLVQDILNLNNYMVYYFTSATYAGVSANTIVSVSLAQMMSHLIGTMKPLAMWLPLFVVILVTIFSVKYVIQLLMWWVLRLLKVMIMTICLPIILPLNMIEGVNKSLGGYLKELIGEIFTHTFVAVGFMVGAQLIYTIDIFSAVYNFPFFIKIAFMVGTIMLVAKMPEVAKTVAKSAGGPSGKDMQQDMGKTMNKVNRTVKNAAKEIRRRNGKSGGNNSAPKAPKTKMPGK